MLSFKKTKEQIFIETIQAVRAGKITEVDFSSLEPYLNDIELQFFIQAAGRNAAVIHSLELAFNEITDLGVQYIVEGLPNLRFLSLHSNNITAAGAKLLAKLPELVELDISHNKIGDEGIEALLTNNKLQKLDISVTYLSIKSMPLLATHPNLRELDVHCETVGDEGVICLAKNNQLVKLNINFTRITDKAVDALLKNRSLLKLKFRSRWNFISEENEITLKNHIKSNRRDNFLRVVGLIAKTWMDKTSLFSKLPYELWRYIFHFFAYKKMNSTLQQGIACVDFVFSHHLISSARSSHELAQADQPRLPSSPFYKTKPLLHRNNLQKPKVRFLSVTGRKRKADTDIKQSKNKSYLRVSH
jgi:hypothetical protein